YTEARHRTIIALRCSASKRSFTSVHDPWYLYECRMLHGGDVRLPSVQTIQRDVERLYVGLGPYLVQYFRV
ncbi:hypothetical protein OF83DRAFT_1027727, partial [Amylostereum chailletii]